MFQVPGDKWTSPEGFQESWRVGHVFAGDVAEGRNAAHGVFSHNVVFSCWRQDFPGPLTNPLQRSRCQVRFPIDFGQSGKPVAAAWHWSQPPHWKGHYFFSSSTIASPRPSPTFM